MKLFNDEMNDLSNEMIAQLGIMMDMIYAVQIMGMRCKRSFDNAGVKKGTFFHEKMNAINEAHKAMARCINQLDIAFDDTFDKIFNRVPGEVTTRTDAMQYLANDCVRLMLIYTSREATPEKRKNMQKALLNFKPDGEMVFDLNEALKYYNL